MLSSLSGNVQIMGWSPDSRLLAVGVQSGIEVINPITNARPYDLIATGPSYDVRFSPDGGVLGIEPAVNNASGSVRLWDLTRNIALTVWDDRFSGASQIAFSPDKLTVAVSDQAGMVDLWNSNTAEIIRSIDVKQSFTDFTTVNGLEFSADGSRFAVFGQAEGIPHVYFFDTATGDAIDDYNPLGLLAGPVAYPLLPPNWRYIVWVSRGTVLLIDPVTHNEVNRFNHEDFVTGVSFTPNADVLVTSSLKTINNIPSNVVSFWNTETGALIGDQPGFTSPPVLAFSPDGTLLATGSENSVETWIIGQ
jgi:WD40 repeat protein